MADLSITSAKYDAARADAEQRFYTATQGRPATEQQRDQSNLVREAIVTAATVIEAEVPEGRNRSLALTALEDALMRANRGIFAPEGHR